MIYHVFSYELCVAKNNFRDPQIRFHRNMESVCVLYVMFTIMFNVIFVFLLAFYVYAKLNSFISVHNTVQSDYTKGPQRQTRNRKHVGATGIFPDKLKVAKVIPLYKKDDKLIMDNYRPIS